MSDFPFDHEPAGGANTQIEYCYRDADNYKKFSRVVIAGRLAAEDLQRIAESLQDSEFFIPQQIGLPPLQSELGRWSDSDHVWHTFDSVTFTDEPADTTLPGAAALVASLPATQQDWEDVRYYRELSGDTGFCP